MALTLNITPIEGQPYQRDDYPLGGDIVVARRIVEDMVRYHKTADGGAIQAVAILADGETVDSFDGTGWTSGTPVPVPARKGGG